MRQMSVISGHLIFTGFYRLTGCQRDPRDRGATEVPKRSVELNDARRSPKVTNEQDGGRGDGEVLKRAIKLAGGVGMSPEVNDEAGITDSMSITSNVGVRGGGRARKGRERENILHKLDMLGHKDFFKSGVKIEEGTLSKGVAEKGTQTRFGAEFVRKVGTQLGKS